MESGTFAPRPLKTRTLDSETNGKITIRKVQIYQYGIESLCRYNQPLKDTGSVIDMPVPSSYNDITTEKSLRDYAGWGWYDRNFFTPSSWNTMQNNVRIRFGSAHYTAVVWINGQQVVSHEGGHLPFEADITEHLLPSGLNLVTVAVNNTLSKTSIPQGEWKWHSESDEYPAGYFEMTYTFDFFNYAGIHRSVLLYTVPKAVAVDDITVQTSVVQDLSSAQLSYDIVVADTNGNSDCTVKLIDREDNVAHLGVGCSGVFTIANPNLWWPYLMHEDPAYLYTLEVAAHNSGVVDYYRLPVGIRHVSWDADNFKINHQNFYFRGFGKHEDSNIRGKGFDAALITKDFNLIKWLGANSFRTSHYPYADEIMDLADK